MDLHKKFIPIIKDPTPTENHVELLPSPELRPYIRCFWGSPKPYRDSDMTPTIVIPDACMDIISRINYTKHSCNTHFSGLNDRYFEHLSEGGYDLISTFGIRFHFWSAHIFIDENYKLVSNKLLELKHLNPSLRADLHNILLNYERMDDRIRQVEILLKKFLYKNHINTDLLNSVDCIVNSKGLIKINQLSEELCISSRKLERIYSNHIGLSPKKIADIVRFQNTWQDIYYGGIKGNLDIAYKYNYSNEAHFITNFKKYFGQTPMKVMSFF